MSSSELTMFDSQQKMVGWGAAVEGGGATLEAVGRSSQSVDGWMMEEGVGALGPAQITSNPPASQAPSILCQKKQSRRKRRAGGKTDGLRSLLLTRQQVGLKSQIYSPVSSSHPPPATHTHTNKPHADNPPTSPHPARHPHPLRNRFSSPPLMVLTGHPDYNTSL